MLKEPPLPLAAQLRGRVIQPGDADYDQARTVYNGMIHRQPRMIARCANAADVMHAVNFGRDSGLLVSIRGGGHSGPGFGVCDDGLVIDLSAMHSVRVDPQSQTVRVEGGCVWGDVDHAAHAFGLAVPTGIISTTGVGGLALGGGHGYLTRKYGLTVDHLLEADVVLADGKFITASDKQHPDLFWALRGGGGNFGVVTSFLFRARPVSQVFAGPMFWPAEQAGDILRWFRTFSIQAPEDLYGFFAFLSVPPVPIFPTELHGKTVCAMIWCYLGTPEAAQAALAPVYAFRKPIFAGLGSMPFPAVNSMFDPLLPTGLQWYWKGDFIREIPEGAIDVHLKFGRALATPLCTMHLYPLDGAVHRVRPDATAFAYRDVNWSMVIAGIGTNPSDKDAIRSWARDYWQALHPFSAGAGYVNFSMDEGHDRVESTYRGNYKRLTEVKKQYDPANLFRVNQNIPPAK